MGNITADNCGPDWPYQYTENDVPGRAPCLTKEDIDDSFPCSSTNNINWFLNTLNDCYAESNIMFNQDNFVDVFSNKKYYKGKETHSIIFSLLT